ncbi:hypothetical protein [Maritalea mediterranea]|uniref:Peptidoglycan binding-like domain-containing protein n=1 Tax=Maritalea mediterranea TaxID=2909667 RepID=A0ABS9E8T1_9HYPH|nr:hypothetical protein [Maritalea mediterranea]MCF4098617.1 hypothetical protein [Maritalea mediterranea]
MDKCIKRLNLIRNLSVVLRIKTGAFSHSFTFFDFANKLKNILKLDNDFAAIHREPRMYFKLLIIGVRRLSIALTLLASFSTTGFAQEGLLPANERSAVRCVQAALNLRGFKAGGVDGLDGPGTQRALGKYLGQAGIELDDTSLKSGTAVDLCASFISGEYQESKLTLAPAYSHKQLLTRKGISILVSSQSGDQIGRKVTGMNTPKIVSWLSDLATRDKGYYRPSNKDKGVVYALWAGIDVGDIVEMHWNFRRAPDELWYTQQFRYEIGEDALEFPIIVANNAFASVQGEFLFQVYVNDELRYQRFVPVY